MGTIVNLVGRKFYRWTVIKFMGLNKHRKATWLCRCKCGNEGVVTQNDLTRGDTKSCGCLKKEGNRFKDETGHVYGRWTVISQFGRDKHGGARWLCRCECGNERVVLGSRLRIRDSQSCGCIPQELRHGKLINLTGRVFGRWTVIKLVPTNKTQIYWLCHCFCGTEKVVSSGALLGGTTNSCGCLKRDLAIQRGIERRKLKKMRRIRFSKGYMAVYLPEHPNARKSGYVSEHVFVMSQIINRPLIKGETVHHKNGIRDDNEPSNLELWAHNHSDGQRVVDLIPYWKKMLELYEPIVEKL